MMSFYPEEDRQNRYSNLVSVPSYSPTFGSSSLYQQQQQLPQQVQQQQRSVTPRNQYPAAQYSSMGSASSHGSAASFYHNQYTPTSMARFNASRGFDVEDDMEFCPALSPSHMGYVSASSSDSNSPSQLPSQLYNETTAETPFSPELAHTGSPKVTARVRKAIQIVDPSTGLRVSSPTLK